MWSQLTEQLVNPTDNCTHDLEQDGRDSDQSASAKDGSTLLPSDRAIRGHSHTKHLCTEIDFLWKRSANEYCIVPPTM